MSSRDYLGEFEHVVVLALLQHGERAYAVAIQQEIEARTNRKVFVGAVHTTLERLQAKGYVESRLGNPTRVRGGRAKRLFRITADGMAAVNRTQRVLQNMTEGLDLIQSYS